MHEIQQQRSTAVAVASSRAAADLVTTLLQVNGIHAWTEAYAGVYPSVEWVEGYRVRVPEHAVEEARALLDALDRPDAAALDAAALDRPDAAALDAAALDDAALDDGAASDRHGPVDGDDRGDG